MFPCPIYFLHPEHREGASLFSGRAEPTGWVRQGLAGLGSPWTVPGSEEGGGVPKAGAT